ncbi:hypothetical protein H8959_003184, partial [Pygathrix nigripes]
MDDVEIKPCKRKRGTPLRKEGEKQVTDQGDHARTLELPCIAHNWIGHLFGSRYVGTPEQYSSPGFANPALLMNKHRCVCGAPYTLETIFSFKVFRVAQSGFVNNISGTALSG